jgi:hypothetical protein
MHVHLSEKHSWRWNDSSFALFLRLCVSRIDFTLYPLLSFIHPFREDTVCLSLIHPLREDTVCLSLILYLLWKDE